LLGTFKIMVIIIPLLIYLMFILWIVLSRNGAR
jgi:hypothetical protein